MYDVKFLNYDEEERTLTNISGIEYDEEDFENSGECIL